MIKKETERMCIQQEYKIYANCEIKEMVEMKMEVHKENERDKGILVRKSEEEKSAKNFVKLLLLKEVGERK